MVVSSGDGAGLRLACRFIYCAYSRYYCAHSRSTEFFEPSRSRTPWGHVHAIHNVFPGFFTNRSCGGPGPRPGSLSVAGADSVDGLVRSDENGPLGNGHGGLDPFTHGVASHYPELRAGLDEGDLTLFGGKVDVTVGIDGRGGMIAADAFLPDDLARVGPKALSDAARCDAVQVWPQMEHRGDHGDTPRLFPRDVGRGDITAPAQSDGADGGPFKPRRGEGQAIPQNDRGHDTFALASDRPEPFARREIKPLDHVTGAADQFGAAILQIDVWCHMGDAGQAARAGPAKAASGTVEGQDPGLVPGSLPAEFEVIAIAAAIAGHDDKVLVQDDGAAEPVLTVMGKVAIGPEDAPLKIERCEAAIGETGVDPFSVRSRGGRRIGVPSFLAAWDLAEDFPVPQDLAGAAIQGDDPAACAVVRGGGEKQMIFPDDRRGPASELLTSVK
jgi:hypothetical protein